MRVANLNGRIKLVVENGLIDVERASDGLFTSDPQDAFDRWDELLKWGSGTVEGEIEPYDESELGPPVPRPRQVFAVALNYRSHVEEAGRAMPTFPGVFTKFPSCLVGPHASVYLAKETVDWEVELVVVMGKRAENVSEDDAWSYVAGLTAGQDISERVLQLGGTFPQLGLAKSQPGFGPIGPAVVSVDEFENPDDLSLDCTLNGVVEQSARTSDLVFNVRELVSIISHLVPMMPGDLLFTGTPGGVGAGHVPPFYLKDGDVLVSTIEGIGTLRNTFTTDRAKASA